MAKRKKKRKKNTGGEHKHQEMMKERNRDFLKTIDKIAVSSGAEEAMKKLTLGHIFKMHMMKLRSFRVVEKKKGTLPGNFLKMLKVMTSNILKSKKVLIKEGCPPISLYDYYFAGSSLRYLLRNLKPDSVKNPEDYELIKESFKNFMKIFDEDQQHVLFMNDIGLFLSSGLSTIDGGYLLIEYDLVTNSDKSSYDCFEVEGRPPEGKYFVLEGSKRPAFKVGFSFDAQNIQWVKIKGEKLGVSGPLANMDFDVYAQSHAINRMTERLTPFYTSETHKYMFFSLLDFKKAIHYKGRMLLEYYIMKHKVGYLIAEINGTSVIIRTFILLTQKGSPEWEKLKEQVGFSPEGISYFDLDKLSTFSFSDLKNDEKLKAIFVKAGCKGLFEVSELTVKRNVEETKAADSLSKYLNLNLKT